MLCILHKLQGSLFYIFARLHRIYRLLLVKHYFLHDICIMRIPGSSVLCSITNKTSIVREGYVRWGFLVSMVISDNFDPIVLPNANTTVDNEHYEGVEELGCSPHQENVKMLSQLS